MSLNHTSIEWVKNPDGSQGYTWNPITGCLNHKDGLCKGGGFPCYAYKLANGRLKSRMLANIHAGGDNFETCDDYHQKCADPFYPRFWPERLDAFGNPYNRRGRAKPKGVFVCDMSDLFGIGVPEKWIHSVFTVINAFPEHRFYLLTKQPQNLRRWSPFPANCWVGATVTTADSLSAAYTGLGVIDAHVKFISFEPLLSDAVMPAEYIEDADIDWLIVGAQTKPQRLPEVSAVRDIIWSADEAGIPVFLKDNLLPLIISKCTMKSDPWAFPKDSINGPLLRQEMPEVM